MQADKMIKKIVSLFLLFSPFISVLAINSFFSISFVCSLLYTALFIFNGNRHRYKASHIPSFLGIYWGWLLVTYVLFSTGEKCINQLIMWSYAFWIYNYFFKKILLHHYSYNEILSNVFKYVFLCVFVTCIYTLIEFTCKNIIGFPIDSYVIHNGLEELDSMSILSGIRCRGLMGEPTMLGNFFLVLGPVYVYYVIRYNITFIIKICLVALLIVSILASFSSAAFGVLPVLLFIYMLYYLRFKSRNNHLLVLAILLLIVLIVLNINQDNFFYLTISHKLNGESGSQMDRESRFEAVRYLYDYHLLTGYGPAAHSTLNTSSMVSFALYLLMNTGVIGLCIFSLYVMQIYRDALRIKEPFLRYSMYASLAAIFCYLLIGDLIYVPWIWIITSFVFVCARLQRNKNNVL